MLPRLWLLQTERTEGVLGAAERLLTADDRARRARLRTARLQRDFTLARWVVREGLSRAAGAMPDAWQFAADPGGRPRVVSPDPEIAFSLSHTDGLIALLVVRGVDAGLDVEATGREIDAAEIAPRFFSALEQHDIASHAESERKRRFLEIWTKKEAYLKARGTGLSLPLDAFSVVPSLAFHDIEDDPEAWQLQAVDVGPAHVGAIAIRGACAPIICERLPETADA